MVASKERNSILIFASNDLKNEREFIETDQQECLRLHFASNNF